MYNPTLFLAGKPVPYKHSEGRCQKFEKPHYKVTNWPAYNAALKRRGDFTMWFTEEAIAQWCPAKTGARGRPTKYSNVAIEAPLFIRQVFRGIATSGGARFAGAFEALNRQPPALLGVA